MEDNIKKIVELEIDLENLELEEMGVQVVSFVEEPAIEVDFLAFSSEEDCEDCFDLDEACWPGYEAIGTKTKNGREVPNCVKIENGMEFDVRENPECPDGYEHQMPDGSYMCGATHQFETYNDYPASAKNAAKRALKWRDEHPDQKCGTRVGWTRANQLAKGENISEETIARMSSFARHLQYKDVPYSEGCGGLMVDAWGGQAGIEWAQNKLERIREESEYNPSGLTPYIDQTDDLRKKEFDKEHKHHVMSDEEKEIILKWAEEHGEQITEEYTLLDTSEEFNTVDDITKAIQGLDILGKLGIKKDEPAEIKYKYTSTGKSAQRDFCRSLMRLNKVYSNQDIITLRGLLSSLNPGMGPRGSNSYNVLAWKGGVNCTHFWSTVALFKPEGSRRVLMIDQGPAAGPAGKSNNSSSTSPAGAVANNASLRFSFRAIDEEQRIVAGPLMVPNKFILRREADGTPYYVFFSKDTIKRIQERFNSKGFQNVTDVDHDGELLEDNILLEQWVIESRVHDKSRYYGYNDLPTGTWFGTYKVNNDETWEKIKSGELKGFSIAGDFINKAQPVDNTEEALLAKVATILNQITE